MHFRLNAMIKYTTTAELKNQLFQSPFDAELDKNNRWMIMEQLVEWDDLAKVLIDRMSNRGRASIDVRYVLGALLIKGLENLSDEDTIRQISENVYMQYFVGLRTFSPAPLFVPEVLVSVRKKLGEDGAVLMNDIMLKAASRLGAIKHKAPYGSGGSDTHRGTLKVDATACPQDVRYPLDTSLLDDSRLKSEGIIDHLWSLGYYKGKKPRTYRKTAKESYLDFVKKKSPKAKTVRKCKKQQLQYLRRNIKTIDKMLDEYKSKINSEELPPMDNKMYKDWLVLQHVYSQQNEMYRNRRRQVRDRIVNLHQPHVRPIVRGKAGKRVEFGAKVNMSETEGFVRMDKIDFNAFNEGQDLVAVIESYKELYSYYPESVLVDKIYLTRSNRNYLKEKGIAHYGAPLGRPPKLSKEEKRKRVKKQNKRSEVEAKFGLAKVKYGLDRVKMRLVQTSKAHIGIAMLCMNIWKLMKLSIYRFWVFIAQLVYRYSIIRRMEAN